MTTKTISNPSDSKIPPSGVGAVIQNNLDYTLFSWIKQKGIAPIAVKHARGVYLYDYDGKRYIDFQWRGGQYFPTNNMNSRKI